MPNITHTKCYNIEHSTASSCSAVIRVDCAARVNRHPCPVASSDIGERKIDMMDVG
jgi:hypothetical protein